MNSQNVSVPLQSIGRDPNIITQAVILAYTGWGYNFYSTTNKLRADDLLIRGEISRLLSRAATDISVAASRLAATIPEPTRQEPLPGRDIMPVVMDMRRLATDSDGFSVKLTALSTPGRDRIWDRHRDQNATLTRLQGFDLYLGQVAFDLQTVIAGKEPADFKDAAVRQAVDAKLTELTNALREREDMLQIAG
jgi:hypothetical protein